MLGVGLVALAMLGGTSCSASPARRAALPSPPAAASPDSFRFPIGKACFGPVPAAWRHGRIVDTPHGVGLSPVAVAGGLAYGQYSRGRQTGVGVLDLATGRLSTIAPFPPDAGGLGALSVDGPWVVWEQLDSRTDIGDWSVHAWNRRTGRSSTLATTRTPAGARLNGAQPAPALHAGVAVWPQPITGTGPPLVQLRATTLATGQSRVLDTGLISSPVHAGHDLVWARVDSGKRFSLRAVDGGTYEPAVVPGLPADPGPVGSLAGSDRYLVWSSQDGTALTVLRLQPPGVRRFVAPDTEHRFQFLQVAGDYVLWYGGAGSSVLDLRTGAGFDFSGTLAGDSDHIVSAASPSASKGEPGSAVIATLAVSATPEPTITCRPAAK